jgi:hypothetical protein
MRSLPIRRYYIGPPYYVKEQNGGFESLATRFAEENFKLEDSPEAGLKSSHIKFSQRVSKIKYDLSGDKAAQVEVSDSGDCVTHQYNAKRVILTTSVGVVNEGIESGLSFEPELLFKDNPFEMKDYVKVFYQFEEKFWDDAEFIVSLKEEGNDGRCHHWQSLDFEHNQAGGRKQTNTSFLPGSRIIFCTLMTEAFQGLLGKTGLTKLTEDQLIDLLDPLRQAYGEDVDTYLIAEGPSKPFHTIWSSIPHFRGAFNNMKPKKTIKEYFEFYGGIFDGSDKFIGPCEHNGCNGKNEWILHISGTASCLEDWEWVRGAINAGKRSGHYVLNDIGCGGSGSGIEFESSCEDFFSNARRRE